MKKNFENMKRNLIFDYIRLFVIGLLDVVSPKKKARSSSITIQDILLLCDLFHLPYEHGERGKKIISDFKWLKENAIDYKQPYEEQKVFLCMFV